MTRVPGFAELPLALRVKVHAESFLQRRLDQNPALAREALERLPAGLVRAARRFGAPLRARPPSPGATLDAKQVLATLAGRSNARVCAAGAPRVSLLIPTHGSVAWLECCLVAIAANTRPGSYEVIVVDDASPDPEAVTRALEGHATRLLRNPRNAGFAASVNRAARNAHGSRLVVLNDDVIVTPGWLERLEAVLDLDPRIGLAGPACNDTGDSATIFAEYSDYDSLVRFAAAHRGEPRPVAKLSLACALIPRTAFEAVGGLDEGYGRGMFEDDDLGMRLRADGASVVLVPDAFVHHAAGATFRRLDPFEYLARFEVNRRRFERRWNVRWRAGDSSG